MAIDHEDTWRMWDPRKLDFLCHMESSSCKNRIHKKNKGIGMSFKVNIPGMNQLRLNWSGRVTPMEEEEAFWS